MKAENDAITSDYGQRFTCHEPAANTGSTTADMGIQGMTTITEGAKSHVSCGKQARVSGSLDGNLALFFHNPCGCSCHGTMPLPMVLAYCLLLLLLLVHHLTCRSHDARLLHGRPRQRWAES